MSPRRTLPRWGSSTRSVRVDASPADVWRVLAAAPAPGSRRWYADAAPLVVRAGIDRVARAVLGPPPVPRPMPGTAPAGLLARGARAGLWRVQQVDHDAHRLDLQADVHAPGRVSATIGVLGAGAGCEVVLRIAFRPSGVVGVVYQVVDLPAREVVVEGVVRAAAGDLRRAGLRVR